ncbi:hypothetical protein J6590_101597 [Homalodisca vitripennis]|nr:hypothetical protein J6590_101597 [Homalodisca vitripennis]
MEIKNLCGKHHLRELPEDKRCKYAKSGSTHSAVFTLITQSALYEHRGLHERQDVHSSKRVSIRLGIQHGAAGGAVG